jgi:hypothetical protein
MYRPRVVQKERAMGAPTGMPMPRELYLDLTSRNLEKMLLEMKGKHVTSGFEL